MEKFSKLGLNLSKLVWNWSKFVKTCLISHLKCSNMELTFSFDIFNFKWSRKTDLQQGTQLAMTVKFVSEVVNIGLDLSKLAVIGLNLSKMVWNLTSNVRTWRWPLSHDLFNIKRSRKTNLVHREQSQMESNWSELVKTCMKSYLKCSNMALTSQPRSF